MVPSVPFFTPNGTLIAQEHHPIAGGERPLGDHRACVLQH